MNNTETTPRPLHILELSIENVKRLSAVHVKPDGESVVIGGRNAQGKSSVLDAITMALSGAKCTKPVHGDEDKGAVTIDLGEIVVKRTFTASGGGTLTVTGKDGAKFASPQKMLDSLLGEIAFDPLAFTRMKPKEQLEALRAITGINTAMLDASRAIKYEERTQIGRHVTDKKALAAQLPHHDDAPAEDASAAALSAKMAEARAINQRRADYISRGRQIANECSSRESGIANIEAQITQLTKQLGEAREILITFKDGLEKLRAEALNFPEADEAGIAAQIDNLEAINRKVRENQARADALKALEEHEANYQKLTAEIEDIDKKKRAKLDAVKMPVSGLGLSDDGITFQGIPFAQASAAEQLRVSVAMGIAANPRLRVLLVRDASLLDAESLALLQAMADECNAQVWIERVGKGEECTIVIEDGRVA